MNETKPCPYCGEQVLAVAVKCKHCGSAIGGPAGSVRAQFKMRPAFKVFAALILLLVGAGLAYTWNQTGTLSGHGFTDEDVAKCKQSIRDEYSKRGMKVEDVVMLKESPAKLTGFVKVQMPVIGSVEKSCVANMAEDGRYLWQCQ